MAMDDDRHVIVEDPLLAQGFTQIPNGVLRRSDLQPGAKLTYMVLLSYAWQKDTAYPGQDRLASDMGVSERSVITYLKQLQETGLITIRRRGLGMTNIYILHRISGSEKSAPLRSANLAAPDLKESTALEVQDLRTKNTQGKDSKENLSNDSKGPSIMTTEEDEQVAWTVQDYAREFNDQAPAKSTTTRALNLFHRSGLEIDDFLDLAQAARVRTKRYSGSVKAEIGPNGKKPKMAYWFAILEEMLGDKMSSSGS
jgi:biotin operon repressor